MINARYIMQAKLLDQSGEAWVSAFNEQAETLLGVSADNLSEMRRQVFRFPICNSKYVMNLSGLSRSLSILDCAILILRC